ncbi:MAG: type II/IV secretion system ATPase subunit [Chloroflexota bacterium]|nr:type II/IV secretion system ATPase subunit [Chloroflexota bacterium]
MIYLPFEVEACTGECRKECGVSLDKCPTYRELPEVWQKVCQSSPHLLVYLRSVKKINLGLPEYCEKLNRSMKSAKIRNFIYPVGSEIFIHVLDNLEDIRDHYVPIEPNLTQNMDGLIDQVEERLTEFVDDLEGIADAAKRIEVIQQIVEKMVSVRGGNGSRPEKNNGNGHKKNSMVAELLGEKKKDKLVVSPIQYQSLRYLLRRKLEGMGVLEPMMRDNNIEDISCSGLGNIFVEHRVFGGLRASIGFETHNELDKFVIELAERIKHPVTFRDPTVDATLPDGSRINIVYGTDVSKRGSNFTIRKFSPTPMSIIELIEQGTLNYEMAAYLSLVIQESMNVWVSGETASGKTTMMNALATFIPPSAKVVSIEDTPEVQVPHHNWIRGVTRESQKSSAASAVSMFDLLKAALRQRPNIIIVGEIRGVEGAIAFQAMQTGHACMSTFHAATVTKLIQRLTGNPINVPKSYVDNLNVVITMSAVRLPSGRTGRRITSVNEIISYDSISDSFSFIETFVWNPVDDTFFFRGNMNSYLLEYKLAPKRGLPPDRRREIYAEIKKRAKVLQRIKEQGIVNFYEVYALLSKAYREGHFR